jgi:hypothetical protein
MRPSPSFGLVFGFKLNDGFVRVAVIWPKNMLHDARMAGLAKLRRSIRSTDERQLRAGPIGHVFLHVQKPSRRQNRETTLPASSRFVLTMP